MTVPLLVARWRFWTADSNSAREHRRCTSRARITPFYGIDAVEEYKVCEPPAPPLFRRLAIGNHVLHRSSHAVTGRMPGMMRKAYKADLSDTEWACIELDLSTPKASGPQGSHNP
jgi:hypothetical protein